MQTQLLDKESFLALLRDVGTKKYHDKHPFHVRTNAGHLTTEAVRGWILNRFYYQRGIPMKDAVIISNCPIREIRRLWLHRISDHDGTTPGTGGIEAWLRLGEACGLSRDEMMDERRVLPAVRFAVDAYVNFARVKPWPVAIASSLTELFAPDLMVERLAAFQKYYIRVEGLGLEYFRSRVVQARVDSDEGLQVTLEYCNTPALQEGAIAALSFKCEVLWGILDGIQAVYGAS